MDADARISPKNFDGAAAWAALPPDVQRQIGATALELALARHLAYGGDLGPKPGPLARAAIEAEHLAREALLTAVLWSPRGIDPGVWIDGTGAYRIPSVVGQVCLSCGCSKHDTCAGGCDWHDEVTCTACAAGVASEAGDHDDT